MTPTLGLGITASGASDVMKLAQAVGQLQNNLAALAKTSGTSNLSNLEGISSQMTRMRREMGVAIAGIRTQLADGFTKAFSDAAKATEQGGEKLADSTKKAAAKVKVAAQSFDLGGGVKASISGSGIDSLGNVRELQESFAKRADVIAVGAEKLSQAQVLARAKMMKGSYDIVQAQERAGASEYLARMAWVGKMQTGSLKYQETAEQAAAREDRARASWRIKMTKGSYDLAQAQAKAAADESSARMAWLGKLQTGSLKIQESIEQAAAREDRAKLLWRVKLMMGSMRLSQEIKDAADREARAIAEANAARAAAAYKQVQLATMRPVGAWSGLGSQLTHNLKIPSDGEAVADTARRTKVATDNMRAFSSSMHDAHSAARGLASGFGLMWLTWGRIAPLLAGAAVSHAVAKSFDVGAEVSYNTKFMQIMSDQTVEASQVVREELRKINEQTKFTLTDLSQAMVNLGQAGKTPKEALQMIKPLADLATVGMTDMKTATDLVIQAQALFGLSAADTDKLVSQLYLTTKSGAVNIEHLGGSMKYASEANTRFGVSVEETLTVLKGLGDAGLKGSSGGTSFINFLRDLHGRSGPAIKALEELRKASGASIKLYDVDEKGLTRMRSAIAIFKDIADASGKLKFEDQDRILAKLFSDRGGRTFFSMIRDGSVNLEKFKEELVSIDRTLAAKSAAALQEGTAKGQLDILKSNLSNTMDTVFAQFESGFIETLKKVGEIVNSTGFKEFLASAIGGVHALTNAVITMREPLLALLAAWLGFKTLTLISGLFQTASTALAGWTAQQVLAGAAAKATTGAMTQQGAVTIALAAEQRALAMGMTAVAAQTTGMAVAAQASTGALRGLAAVVAFLANPLVGVITTLALFGTAWYTASQYADQGTRTITDAVQKNGALNITQFQKEINLLRERNALLGISEDPYAGAVKAMDNSVKVRQAKLARVATIDNSPYASSAANVSERAKLVAEVAEIDRNIFSASKALDRARTSDYLAEQKAAADAKAKQDRLLNGLGQNPNAPGLGGGKGGKAAKPGEAPIDWEAWAPVYAIEELVAQDEALAKTLAEVAKANEAYTKTIVDQVQASRDAVKVAEDELNLRGKSKSELEELNLLRLEEIYSQQYLANPEDNLVLEAKIEASKKLLDIYRKGELLDLNDKAAAAAAAEWKQVGNSLVDNLMRGGKAVKDYLKDLFRTLVLRPVLQPVGVMMSAGMQSVLGYGANGGSGGILSSVGSSLLGKGASTMVGTALGTSLTGTMGGTFGAGVMGGLGVGGTGYSLSGGLSLASSLGPTAGGAGALLGTLAPWLAGAYALSEIFGSKGGPKTEGTDLTEGLKTRYAELVSSMGLQNNARFESFYSKDPEGDSLTQLRIAAYSGNRHLYERPGEENVGRSDAEFNAEVGRATLQALAAALEASGLEKVFVDYLNNVPADATQELRDTALNTVTAVRELTKSLETLGGPFRTFGQLTVDARKHMIDLAGSVEALAGLSSDFISRFYSEAEQQNFTWENLVKTFQTANLVLPSTAAGYRALYEAQDLTTEAGRRNAVVLLQNASAFDSLYNEAAKLEKATSDTDSAMSALRRSVERQTKILTVQRDAAQSLVEDITSVFDVLKNAVNELYGEVESVVQVQAAAGQSFIAQALANARATGVLPDSEELSDAITKAREGLNGRQFATQADADFERLVLAGQLNGLKDIAGTQLSNAEAQLKYLEDQLTALEDLVTKYDEQITTMREGNFSIVEAINRLTIALAVEKGITPQPAGGSGSGSSSVSPGMAGVYAYAEKYGDDAYYLNSGNDFAAKWASAEALAKITGQSPEEALRISTGHSSQYWRDVQAAWDAGKNPTTNSVLDYAMQGSSADRVAESLSGQSYIGSMQASLPMFTPEQSAAFWGIPQLASGTNYMPKDMFAFLHKGESVVPAEYNYSSSNEIAAANAAAKALLSKMDVLIGATDVGNYELRRSAEALNGNPEQPMLVTTT